MTIPHQRILRCSCVAAVLFVGGCTLPPVRISQAPIAMPLPELPRVIDRRPAADLGLRPRDPDHDPVDSYYLSEKDTVPDRMSVLRSRLATVDYLQKPGSTVIVDKFDILYDGSGDASALTLNLSGKGLGMLDTMPIGNGINGYRCTLIASIEGEPGGPLRQIARGQYAHEEGTFGMTPEQHQAAIDCVENVIDQWVDYARPLPPIVEEPAQAPAPKPKKKSVRKRRKS